MIGVQIGRLLVAGIADLLGAQILREGNRGGDDVGERLGQPVVDTGLAAVVGIENAYGAQQPRRVESGGVAGADDVGTKAATDAP